MFIFSVNLFKNKKRNLFIKNNLLLFLFIVLVNITIFSANAKEVSQNSSQHLFKEQQIQSIKNFIDNFYTLLLAENKQNNRTYLQQALNYSKFLTPEVNNKIIKAQELEQNIFKVTPKGEKPFYWEGSVFTGVHEGPTTFIIDTIKFSNKSLNKAEVTMKLTYFSEGSTEKPYIWYDTIIFIQHNKQWKIADIQMPEKDSSLLKILDKYIAESFIKYNKNKPNMALDIIY